MNIYTAEKTFTIEGAHILESSYAKECQQIHGHSYAINIEFVCTELNEDGMVIDFKKIKETVGKRIMELDHVMLMTEDTYFSKGFYALKGNVGVRLFPKNPTAEHIAEHVYDLCKELVSERVKIYQVQVRETASGKATFFKDSVAV